MKRYIILILIFFCLIPCAPRAEHPADYNDPNLSKEVNTLRKFRDEHLEKYALGRAFIDYYYEYGPIAAEAIKGCENLKSLVRLSLLPLMYAGRNFNAVLVILRWFIAFTLYVFFWYIARRIKAEPVKNRRIPVVYRE